VLGACQSTREDDEVEMRVSGVLIDPVSHIPVVVLENRASGIELPIWIGPTEARAIAMHLEGIESARPLTHDLLKNIIDAAHIELDHVLIHSLRDGTYHARIFLTAREDRLEIDSRPSDAIALAVRCEKPIFVVRSLLTQAPGGAGPAAGGAETLTIEGLTIQAVSEQLAEYFEITPGKGVLVSAVTDDAPADLMPGDVILEIDGKVVRDPLEFATMVRDSDRQMELSVQRHGVLVHVAFGPVRR